MILVNVLISYFCKNALTISLFQGETGCDVPLEFIMILKSE